jgi:hypothetical protein
MFFQLFFHFLDDILPDLSLRDKSTKIDLAESRKPAGPGQAIPDADHIINLNINYYENY